MFNNQYQDLYEIGKIPPLGHVPKKMYAWTLRQERYGDPIKSFQIECVDVPEPKEDDVLICVMAAGLNFNGIFAAKGIPKDLVKEHKRFYDYTPYHICGSEASGIVYKVGKNIKTFKPGDKVVLGGGQWDPNCPLVQSGEDPTYSSSYGIWGYEVNFGGFAQFCLNKVYQCFPKPENLTWEEAASYLASGATIYRMLYHWKENAVRPGDIVLIWGGAGGIGSMAIQIVKNAGALPITVISDQKKVGFCKNLGAIGCINRNDFDHWGPSPDWRDKDAYKKFLKNVLSFRRAIWKIVREKRNPKIVIEHPGEDTIATSLFLCDKGGMVVICGGTTGYNASLDLRPFWYFQKRFQGSHGASPEEARETTKLMRERKIRPTLTKTYKWEDLSYAHQLMTENKHPLGNTAVLVGTEKEGTGADK